jgi:hypothetical protein
VVLLQEIVTNQFRLRQFDDTEIIPVVLFRQRDLRANPSSQAKITQSMQLFCFGGVVGFGAVVDGRGRVAEGAEGTAGALTPEEAL